MITDKMVALLHDSRERISAAIALADAWEVARWIPVHESLPPVAPGEGPEVSDEVLCAAPTAYERPIAGHVLYFPSGRHVWRLSDSPSDWNHAVTHWMPMPRMP
jgi:hypothetical protein